MQKENRKYYEAYEDRYKTAHEKGVSWEQMKNTPIVMDIINRYHLHPEQSLLEIGCGEGRDSATVLENGFHLMATDISPEAIDYCKKKKPDFESKFMVLDCLSSYLNEKFDFIYSIAVVHMFVLDEDRNGFYQFIRSHLKSDGIALICSMGDGNYEMLEPFQGFVEIQVDGSRIRVRIVGSDLFDKFTITWRPAVCNDDMVERIALLTATC